MAKHSNETFFMITGLQGLQKQGQYLAIIILRQIDTQTHTHACTKKREVSAIIPGPCKMNLGSQNLDYQSSSGIHHCLKPHVQNILLRFLPFVYHLKLFVIVVL